MRASLPISEISEYPLKICFSQRELGLLEELLNARSKLPEDASLQLGSLFDRSLEELVHVVRAIDSSPSIHSSDTFAGQTRSIETLIDNLCESEPPRLDFVLPTRAILGQAFLSAKINFLKALIHILSPIREETAEGIRGRLEDILGDAIYFKLSEELLTASVSNAANPLQLKQAAARLLIRIWEQRLIPPMEDFTGLLLSGWRARCRTQEIFGTMVGVHEVFSLLRAECEPRFLDFFTRKHVTEDEMEAFREFLFGIPFEGLEKLRKHMDENQVTTLSRQDVVQLLGHSFAGPNWQWSPETVYISYRKRRMRADYRVLAGSPGPRKTAEGYLMEYYLLEATAAAKTSTGF